MPEVTLREALMRDEGLRLMPYRDSAGLWTVGYGHCLERKGISRRAAEVILDDDIADARADLERHLPWALALDLPRQEALVNLIFNIGAGGLLGFKKMLAALEAGDFHEAARELLDSKYAAQVGPRAQRLARQIETGERQ